MSRRVTLYKGPDVMIMCLLNTVFQTIQRKQTLCVSDFSLFLAGAIAPVSIVSV